MAAYLVYSSDEGWWYWQKGDLTSQPFFNRESAVKAMKDGCIDWQE